MQNESMNAPLSESPPPREERRAISRHPRASRAVWIATRARNASRRGWRITAVGALAVIATLLVLVLIPREVDRSLREQLDRIPPPVDTLPIAQQLVAMAARATAQRLTDSLRVVEPAPLAAPGIPVVADTVDRDLAQRIARARDVPLAESYLALAGARTLRNDVRVRAIADSIEQVDRERDAYAALGGADARYAALTSRLAALGQRLVRIAESHAADSRASDTRAPDGRSVVGTASDSASAVRVTAAVVDTGIGARVAPTTVSNANVPEPDSAPTRHAMLADSAEQIRQRLAAVRLSNAALEQRRADVRSRLNVSVPPMAMLLSALMVGLSVGYGVSVVRELRRPTVGDEAEIERLTNARVIPQRIDTRRANPTSATAAAKRRGNSALPTYISSSESAYPLLHLALTGIGDVAHAVEIVAEQPQLASVVALNIATIAARESRTTLVVEDASVAHLFDALMRQQKGVGTSSDDGVRSSSVTSIVLDRDLTIDLLRARTPADGRARVIDQYDLALVPSGSSEPTALVNGGAPDLIVCVRSATTPLTWLAAVTERARARGQRIRAVLLWSSELPTA